MARKRREPVEQLPPLLYSLTFDQAQILREARDTEGGAYLAHVGLISRVAHGLVDGGCAGIREEHRIDPHSTRSVSDPRPCEWTDRYLVPTAYGIKLLQEDDERRKRDAEERARLRRNPYR